MAVNHRQCQHDRSIPTPIMLSSVETNEDTAGRVMISKMVRPTVVCGVVRY